MMERAPDRASVRESARGVLPPRPDSPRPGGLGGARMARLAQTRVWGEAAKSQRWEDRDVRAVAVAGRPMSVFGTMRREGVGTSTMAVNRAHCSEWRGAAGRAASFRRAASLHRYARVAGSARNAAPTAVLREQLAAIDDGLGAVHVVETPVLRAGPSVAIPLQRASSGSVHSLHDTPIEA